MGARLVGGRSRDFVVAEGSVNTIPTNKGPMTPESIVDYLTYCSYRAQRELHGVSAEMAIKWYPNGEAMEAKYQADTAIEKARAA